MSRRKIKKTKRKVNVKKHEKVMIVIAFLLSVIFFKGMISEWDFKKATPEDWQPLYEQAEMIQNQELEAVPNTENLDVEITIKSEECALILKIGEDNKFSKIIEEDNALPMVRIVATIIASILGAGTVFLGILLGELMIAEKILRIWNEKLKRKRESNDSLFVSKKLEKTYIILA